MKQFKIIALFVLLVQLCTTFQTFGKPKYRIVVKQIEGILKYIPQVKTKVPDYMVKRWKDISNQPLSSENEARNYVVEAQIIDKQLQQSTIINYIYIK
jgi:hypothetical protein